jgi:hypothetical protein
MRALVRIKEITPKFYAVIYFVHDLIDEPCNFITTTNHTSKGQLKRKVIQFCSELNMEVWFI